MPVFHYLREMHEEPSSITAESAVDEGHGIWHFVGVTAHDDGDPAESVRVSNVVWCVPEGTAPPRHTWTRTEEP